MLPARLYDIFKQIFPERVPYVKKYKGSKTNGGIDISFTDGTVLNFNVDKNKNWVLKGVEYHGDT